ncbi:hypothetical protein CIRG_06367 [Coccidioides immitis RMSCC 2394]|uniref:Endonuclease/exonuclease/phosphatase domain-containing protein n=1 Tax=Coccidioides immitis RMSCC 2394 TaxID=404692 RepID=A0A0J6YD99_COCIT|nr:hypothetical protein CIRG_06367 [Coccidioides immitis RMSCC 2394]
MDLEGTPTPSLNLSQSHMEYNVMKSKDKIMASLLRDKIITKYNIVAIQEPWRNPFRNTTHNSISQYFELAYMDNRKTRLRMGAREEVICICNVYNPIPNLEPTNSTITTLQQAMLQHWGKEKIIVGDFNLHHPYWRGANIYKKDSESEKLLLLLDEYKLGLLFQPATITYQTKRAETTIDLAMITLEEQPQRDSNGRELIRNFSTSNFSSSCQKQAHWSHLEI